jgi:hypothetical protein
VAEDKRNLPGKRHEGFTISAAAIYARYSSDLQREASIEDQNRICRERAAREGWSVYKYYSDHGISGASLIRPGIQKLLQDALEGRFGIVITESLDRLSRDQEDIAHIFKRISFAGGRPRVPVCPLSAWRRSQALLVRTSETCG